MKKTTLIIFAILFSIFSNAQTTSNFNYQAVVRNSTGIVLDNQNVSFRISILQGAVTGSSVYTETHLVMSNEFGLVNLVIGNGTTSENFSVIDWSTDTYFIKIELDENGGTSFSEIGISQLLSVPYSNYAGSSNYENLINKPQNVTTTNDGFMSSDDKNKLDTLVNADGSETKIIAGENIIITGDGTFANPYVVNVDETSIFKVPDAITLSATNIESNEAQLNALVNANNFATGITFEWGLTTSYGNIVSANQSQATGNIDENIDITITGLDPNTLYHYRVKATNAIGVTYGVDSTFTSTSLPPLTIYDVQSEVDGNGNSNYDGFIVTLNGIVVANTSNSYIIQDGYGAWNGIYIYDGAGTIPNIGDEVTVTGTVTEYINLTELTSITTLTVNSTGNVVPNPVLILSNESDLEQYESVLVKIETIILTNAYGNGEYGYGGTLRINDTYYDYGTLNINDYYSTIVGVIEYSYNEFKIAPRSSTDMIH